MKIAYICDYIRVDLFLLRCKHNTMSHECSVFACDVVLDSGRGRQMCLCK
ncbi:hypothetical protein PAHAL_6G194600 [Panicum hallii]|uniref:Uncharacterized protein n=1 Tax=Panicum hallii TaxID=206008 RepID=A0A2T8IGV6_9POAL|nr:hypothetical protein PAHAL_6G194600 [Panicum hallii]